MARARANAARPDNSPAANAMYELFGVDPASVALQDELDTLRRAAGIAKPPPLKVTWTTVDCSANDNNDEEECGGDDDDGSHL